MMARRFLGEQKRIDTSPMRGTEGPPELATFMVATGVNAIHYVERFRAVLSAAIRTANDADFDSGRISETLIPDWFAEATCGSTLGGRDSVASAGSRQYVSSRGEEPWDLQEWLYCLDPQLRGWAWWDMTHGPDDMVVLWVDSSGEPVFPCEELRWLAYVCGAVDVAGPLVRSIAEWRQSLPNSAR